MKITKFDFELTQEEVIVVWNSLRAFAARSWEAQKTLDKFEGKLEVYRDLDPDFDKKCSM